MLGGQRHTPTFLPPRNVLPVDEDNIKTDIQGTGCEDMDWNRVSPDRPIMGCLWWSGEDGRRMLSGWIVSSFSVGTPLHSLKWLNDGFFQTVCSQTFVSYVSVTYHVTAVSHILSVIAEDFFKRKMFGAEVVGRTHREFSAFSVSLTVLVKMDL